MRWSASGGSHVRPVVAVASADRRHGDEVEVGDRPGLHGEEHGPVPPAGHGVLGVALDCPPRESAADLNHADYVYGSNLGRVMNLTAVRVPRNHWHSRFIRRPLRPSL